VAIAARSTTINMCGASLHAHLFFQRDGCALGDTSFERAGKGFGSGRFPVIEIEFGKTDSNFLMIHSNRRIEKNGESATLSCFQIVYLFVERRLGHTYCANIDTYPFRRPARNIIYFLLFGLGSFPIFLDLVPYIHCTTTYFGFFFFMGFFFVITLYRQMSVMHCNGKSLKTIELYFFQILPGSMMSLWQ
jgi:hypothetical protein